LDYGGKRGTAFPRATPLWIVGVAESHQQHVFCGVEAKAPSPRGTAVPCAADALQIARNATSRMYNLRKYYFLTYKAQVSGIWRYQRTSAQARQTEPLVAFQEFFLNLSTNTG
jgi:hypothetical protein